MKDLQKEKVWAVHTSVKNAYIQPGGKPAIANKPKTLATFEHASNYLHWLHHHNGERWPPDYSLALALNATGGIIVTLLNCWSEERGIAEGAARWTQLLCSYTERCNPKPDGISVRCLVRGTLPDSPEIPKNVLIQSTGFCSLTMQRISARPIWMPDNGDCIMDGTEALNELLKPRRPRYITI